MASVGAPAEGSAGETPTGPAGDEFRRGGDRFGERARSELLRDLTNAYLAVAAEAGSGERIEEAARQVERGARRGRRTRVELGQANVASAAADDSQPIISAPLPGAAGRLVAIGSPDRAWSEADQAALQQLALLVHGPITDARLLEFAERLERVGALLGGESEPESIIDRLLDEGLEQTSASFGAILLPDVWLRLVGDRRSGGWVVGSVAEADGDSPITTVASSGRPMYLTDDAAMSRWANEVAPTDAPAGAWALVPLRSGSRQHGVLGLRFASPQPFDAAERSFLNQVGDRLATALDRSRVFAGERDARRDAEQATARVAQLRQLAAELAQATTRRGVAATLLRHAFDITGATSGMVAAHGSRADDVSLLAAVGPAARTPLVDDALAEAAASIADAEPFVGPAMAAPLPDRLGEQLRAEGVDALAIHPLFAGSRQVGGILLGWDQPSAPLFDPDQLQAAVTMAGPALRRAGRFDVDHDIAITLQRSMLTPPEIDIAGITWSARYRSGSTGVAGGDWYDIIDLGGGRVGVAIGDVVGKGVQAAAAMGQLRSATRALARRLDDPADLLEALDDYARTTGQGLYSSALFMVLDIASGVAHHAVAGHPPPVLWTPGSDATLVEAGRGPLLGVETARTAATLTLAPGDVVVLYTDGLVERRDRTLDDGLAALRAIVGAGPTEPGQLCRHVMDAFVDETFSDDIAIVAVRLDPPAPVR